eukprot:TRINITY_DN1483_c0_g1_i1.p1 TRINITY_DN1483_c0_g1~~TRINITY_DN1483_c0_g1_i1.p1  ORF type:complete len:1077 (-),score=261.49 TRINITY_DN1483_c0_g1_i1:20-3250(-)
MSAIHEILPSLQYCLQTLTGMPSMCLSERNVLVNCSMNVLFDLVVRELDEKAVGVVGVLSERFVEILDRYDLDVVLVKEGEGVEGIKDVDVLVLRNPDAARWPEGLEEVVQGFLKDGKAVIVDESLAFCSRKRDFSSFIGKGENLYVLTDLSYVGMDIGLLISENTSVLDAVNKKNSDFRLPQVLIEHIQTTLPDKETTVTVVEKNLRRAAMAYANTTKKLDFLGIPYVESISGTELILDLPSSIELNGFRSCRTVKNNQFFLNMDRKQHLIDEDCERISEILKEQNLSSEAKAKSSINRFEKTWALTDLLFCTIFSKSIFKRPIEARHPFIFYLGHLPGFFINQFKALLEFDSFNAAYDKLFERGIDPDEEGNCHSHSADINHSSWPTYEAVLEYAQGCRNIIKRLTSEITQQQDVSEDILVQRCRIFEIAIEHEYMHQETLLYMAHQLSLEDIVKPEDVDTHYPIDPNSPEIKPSYSFIEGNSFNIGAELEDPNIPFGWDNEFPTQKVDVSSFSIQKTPVTNAQFYKFYKAGGYTEQLYWTGKTWKWKEKDNINKPVNWIIDGDTITIRVLFGTISFEEGKNLPVQVSHAEADAYCRWAGGRLPTEEEWYHAAYSRKTSQGTFEYTTYPWGEDAPTEYHANFGFNNWSPSPVNAHPDGKNYWGLMDLIGNGWEWTSSVFAGFEGYTPYIRTYELYSSDFFDGEHYVMKGGSFSTVIELLRPSFRNWFRPHYPYVFSQFRVVLEPIDFLITRLGDHTDFDSTKSFVQEVITNLSKPVKKLSPMYLYDEIGSQIYTEITQVEEYYLPSLEKKIFREQGANIVSNFNPDEKLNVVELGAGDGKKTTILLKHMQENNLDITYLPVDISEQALVQLNMIMSAQAEISVPMKGLCGDNIDCIKYLSSLPEKNVLLWLGSSVGNFEREGMVDQLVKIHNILKEGDYFLICFDMKKPGHIIHKAYYDSLGVATKFAMNILGRMNRDLGANIDLSKWEHHPIYDPILNSVVSHLIATEEQIITFEEIPNFEVKIKQWEAVHLENSHKFDMDEILSIANESGYTVLNTYFDSDAKNYAVSVWKK